MTYWLESKRPAEVRIYTHDWSGYLGEDTISTSSWSATGATIDTDDNDDTTVTVTVSGGTAGAIAQLTNTVVTSGGETEIETFALLVVAADEPVNLSEAKAQCRMSEDDSEDTFIASLIAPARAYVERMSRFQLVAATREESFSRWGDYLEIYRRPIASVDEIVYTDGAGEEAEYADFLAPLGNFPLRIYPGVDDEFPDIADGGSITVTYTTGAVDGASEEYLIAKRAILLLIGHWFENREAAVLGVASNEVDFALRSMLDTLGPVSGY